MKDKKEDDTKEKVCTMGGWLFFLFIQIHSPFSPPFPFYYHERNAPSVCNERMADNLKTSYSLRWKWKSKEDDTRTRKEKEDTNKEDMKEKEDAKGDSQDKGKKDGGNFFSSFYVKHIELLTIPPFKQRLFVSCISFCMECKCELLSIIVFIFRLLIWRNDFAFLSICFCL